MQPLICPFRAVTEGPQSPLKYGICSLNVHPIPPESWGWGRHLGFQGCHIQGHSFPLHGALQSLSAFQASPCHLQQIQQFCHYYFLIFTYQNYLNNCKLRIWVFERLKKENKSGKCAIFQIPLIKHFLRRCLGVILGGGRSWPYIHHIYPYISRISIPKSWSNTALFTVIAAVLQILPLNSPRADGGSLLGICLEWAGGI